MKTLLVKPVDFKLKGLNHSEIISYFLLASALLIGLYTSYYQPYFFEFRYAQEDGSIENLTALMMLASAMVAYQRLFTGKFKQKKPAFLTTLGIGIACFFVAGEEISWGQRIFNLESGVFFETHNAQYETNFHNLVINDIELNKLIFGKLLTTVILLYTILFPVLYNRQLKFRAFIDHLGIPMLKNHHSIAFIIGIILVLLIPNNRKWEMYELTVATMAFLILRFPVNENLLYKSAEQVQKSV
jgi:hypothetical protein